MSPERGQPADEPYHGERFFGGGATAPQRRYGGRSATVAVARTTERHRDAESIAALTRRAIDLLGGITGFVRPGQRVLIKPNCTGYFLADEGITTDPRLVAALIRLCFQAGASAVTVGESAGMEQTRAVLRATGMAAAARAAGARVVAFDDCELREVDVPGGRAIRRIALPVPLLEADVVINACKGKTHHMDPVSGAIKNWVGAIPLTLRMQHHDVHTFAEYVDVMSVTRPALHVCDAIIVGEGDGPLANTPRWCGCVLASADPAALDVTLCRLFSLDPDEHKFAAEAAERDLGTNDPACITMVGDPLEDARIEVRRPRRGWDYYPFNVIVGGGVTYAGTLGHWKSIADAFLRDGTWVKVMAARGVPTFLIGDADDPDFERHVSQGPYFVIDDVAPARYRLDPRVHVIRGHPALHNMLPELLRGLGLTLPGRLTQRAQQWTRLVESRLLYVPRARSMRDAARAALVVGGIGVLALGAIRSLQRYRDGIVSRAADVNDTESIEHR
jgi:uncharacterized protein (DUF362 family)